MAPDGTGSERRSNTRKRISAPGWTRRQTATFHSRRQRGPTMQPEQGGRTGPLTADGLTALLAECVLGWRSGPDRFMMADRQWLPRGKFRPTTRIEAAF